MKITEKLINKHLLMFQILYAANCIEFLQPYKPFRDHAIKVHRIIKAVAIYHRAYLNKRIDINKLHEKLMKCTVDLASTTIEHTNKKFPQGGKHV